MKATNRRILIADDLSSIHEDFSKILRRRMSAPPIPGLASFAPQLAKVLDAEMPDYELSFALQGEEAVRKVEEAKAEGRPFAVAFLDVRMPPGIDGVETAERLRILAPDLQVVLCTAYSDYSFGEISRKFRDSDHFLILKKPFDPAEILQVAQALTRKWTLAQENATLIADLEARVKERTVQLEAALLEARKGEQAKARFLSSVSHELYTPLNGILMSAELLQMSQDEEAANYGKLILASCERLQRMFTRILTYVELDDRPKGQSHVVGFVRIFRKLEEQFRPMAEGKGLRLEVHPPEVETAELKGSEVQLQAVLEILLENAVTFTEQGGVALRMELGRPGAVGFLVEDTGPGLPKALEELLAEVLTPGDLSFHRKHDGLGLGLNLGKRLVEHFGGSLAYRGGSGGGSAFEISLPRTSQVDANVSAAAS